MRRLRLLLAPAVAVGVATWAAGAMAQDATPTPATTATAPRDPRMAAAVALALKVVASAASAEAEVDGLLTTSVKNNDGVKTAYLTEKKSQIGVIGKIAQARRKLLVAAAGRGDTEVAKHLTPLLTVLEARLTELKTQAHQGVGKTAGAAAAKSEPTHKSDDTRSEDARSDDARSDDSSGSSGAATGPAAAMFWLSAQSLGGGGAEPPPGTGLQPPPCASPTK